MTGSESLIWLIDDEPDLAMVYADALVKDAIRVEIFGSAEEALEKIISGAKLPELIVTDLNLPKMDGITFLKTIREKLLELPVILVSGGMDRENLVKASNLSITGFLEKPFDLEVFRAKVLETIKNKTHFDIDAELISCLKNESKLLQEIVGSVLGRLLLAEQTLKEIDPEKHFSFANSKANYAGSEKERRIAKEVESIRTRIENLWPQSTFSR